MMTIKGLNILLVEDDEDDYLIIKNLFSRMRNLRCDLHWVSSYHIALEFIGDSDQDVYLIDYRLGDGNGLDLLRKVRANGCVKPIIILTGQGDRDVDVEAMEAGASDYLVKGELNVLILERSIRYAINMAQTIDTLCQAHDELAIEVDDRKKAEIELIKAKKNAENASRIKSEFLSNVSHEIRTPMCTIIGMSELLSESALSREQKVYVKTAMQAGNDLLHLIDKIINISKIESAQVKLEEVMFDFDDLPLKIASLFEKSAHEKNLKFTCHVAPNVPIKLVGDPEHLEQILTHIINNAIKFTEQGEISLDVCQVKRPKATEETISSYINNKAGEIEECYLQFSVTDTGVGIPNKKLQTIFDSFSQADSSNTRAYAGVGLGITISRKLIGMMGGKIWVESEEGKGSIFYFDVRLWKQVKNNANNTQAINLNGMKLLIIDGGFVYQSIIKKELIKHGALVELVQSCGDGIRKINSSALNEMFDLVIIDCFPEMNRSQFMDEIKYEYMKKNGLSVLFLDEYCKHLDEDKMPKHKMVSCIKKPVRTANLILEIKKMVSFNFY